VIYVSRHGASKRYAEAIAEALDGEAQSVEQVESFWGDAIVFVAGVYNHKLNPDMLEFIQTHRSDLYGRMWPVWLSVSSKTREHGMVKK